MGGLAQAFFKMPAAGKEITAFTVGDKTIGTVTPAGAGHGNGSQTMPGLARMSSVVRQHIQRMANKMVTQGLVEFIANTAHIRSRSLAIAPAGVEIYFGLSTRFAKMAERLAADMDLSDLEMTVATLPLARKLTSKRPG